MPPPKSAAGGTCPHCPPLVAPLLYGTGTINVECVPGVKRTAVEGARELTFQIWDKPFVVELDASGIATGAVLCQEGNAGRLVPLEFYSSSLNETQRKFSAGELEAYGMVAAVRKWKVYLQAETPVILVSDHCPLQWLRKQKDPRGKYVRWLLELESIPYTIVYRRGKDNGGADYISRIDSTYDKNVNDETERFERFVYSLEGELGSLSSLGEELTRGQKEDSVISNAIKQLYRNGQVNEGGLKAQDGLRVNQKRLLFKKEAFVVPKKLCSKIVNLAHRQSHAGIEKSYEYLKERFFWKGMRVDVEEHCKSCMTCLENKRSTKRKEELKLIDLDVQEPRLLIAADITTLPGQKKGTDTSCVLLMYSISLWN